MTRRDRTGEPIDPDVDAVTAPPSFAESLRCTYGVPWPVDHIDAAVDALRDLLGDNDHAQAALVRLAQEAATGELVRPSGRPGWCGQCHAGWLGDEDRPRPCPRCRPRCRPRRAAA